MSLLVTIATRGGPTEQVRAERVAERCGARTIKRPSSLEPLLARGDTVYVVGKEKDELRWGSSVLAVHEGLLRQRLHTGVQHPLIRALAPSGTATHVVDGTLGLAGDALHVAGALDCAVTGIELSPTLFSLLEEGLARLGANRRAVVARAARHITPVLGDSTEAMAAMEADSADAVLLAPMYPNPDKAAPGFEILRAYAVHDPLSEAAVEAALHVAPRLVVKWPGRAQPPPTLVGKGSERIGGSRVDYWVLTR